MSFFTFMCMRVFYIFISNYHWRLIHRFPRVIISHFINTHLVYWKYCVTWLMEKTHRKWLYMMISKVKKNAKLDLWLGFWSTVLTLSCIKNQKYKKNPLYVCEICKVYHDKYFAASRGFTVHLGHNTIQWS